MQLSGDEIGHVLGEYVASRPDASGTLASSIVSSQLLGEIAKRYGLDYTSTLTGFKWIARSPGIIFGYEEAIGYCVNPRAVKDKDGLSASLLLASIAANLKPLGGIEAELDRIATEYGVYLTSPVTVRVEDLSIIPATMAKVRTQTPQELGGSRVVQVDDLSQGSPDLPPTDAMRLVNQAGDRVIVRPSGTEPKVKCYLEVVAPVEGDLVAARAAATERMERFKNDVAAMLEL